LEGLKIALDNLDTLVILIRNSGSRAEAKENIYEGGAAAREILMQLEKTAPWWQVFRQTLPESEIVIESLEISNRDLIVTRRISSPGLYLLMDTQISRDSMTRHEDGLSLAQIDAFLELQLYRSDSTVG
jgi:DNA gyrase/topoisomerase IV subunit A